jgi:hypothetical protein
VLLTTAVSYGEMKSDIRSLSSRVGSLEEQVGKVARPKVLKGDLCLQVFEGFESASGNAARMRELNAQLEKLNCYEGVSENAVARIEPEDRTK